MTSSDCGDPTLAERILDDLVRGGARTPEHDRHLRKCRHCAVAFERSSRIAHTWRQMDSDHAELVSARAAFLAFKPRARRTSMTPVAIVAAVLLVGTLALAGVRIAALRPPALLTRASTSPKTETVATPLAPRPIQRSPLEAALRVDTLPSLPPFAAPPAPPTTQPLATTPASPVTADTSHVGSLPALAPSAHETTARLEIPVPATSPARGVSASVAAAAAMRAGDYATAERSLDELVRSDDAKTRDDARLARAQVWIAQQRPDRARPELEDLAATGRTSLVREQAAQALRTMIDSSTSP